MFRAYPRPPVQTLRVQIFSPSGMPCHAKTRGLVPSADDTFFMTVNTVCVCRENGIAEQVPRSRNEDKKSRRRRGRRGRRGR